MASLATAASCDSRTGPRDADFLNLLPAERREQLRGYPPQDQVRLFLIAAKAEHPRDLGLSDALASGGKAVLPAIVAQLKIEEDQIDQLFLLEVLGMMKRFGYYDVASDTDALQAARAAVANISEARLKRQANSALEEILREDGPER